MVEDTPVLTFSGDVVSEEVVIIASQEDMERSLFYVFTPEQDKHRPHQLQQQKTTKGKRAQSKSGKYPCTACQRVYGDMNDPVQLMVPREKMASVMKMATSAKTVFEENTGQDLTRPD